MPRRLHPTPLIVGGAQPEGYLYVGLNQGTAVWGHTDIVAVLITIDDEEQAKHTVWLVYMCCLQSLSLGSARHFWGGARLEISSFLFSRFLEVLVGVCMAISSRCKCGTV